MTRFTEQEYRDLLEATRDRLLLALGSFNSELKIEDIEVSEDGGGISSNMILKFYGKIRFNVFIGRTNIIIDYSERGRREADLQDFYSGPITKFFTDSGFDRLLNSFIKLFAYTSRKIREDYEKSINCYEDLMKIQDLRKYE